MYWIMEFLKFSCAALFGICVRELWVYCKEQERINKLLEDMYREELREQFHNELVELGVVEDDDSANIGS